MISLVDIVNLNKLVYSEDIKKKHLDVINNPSPLFEKFDLTQWMGTPPPQNGSRTTFKEILQIDSIPMDSEFIHSGDKTIKYFENWFIENTCGCNHTFPKAYINKIKDATRPLILKLKYHYNRPRPIQVAETHGLKFHEEPLESAKTPAYPSGHATQGMLIAMILSEMYPEHTGELMNLGTDVANSRMVAKVHYPSDTKFGCDLAKALFNHIKQNSNMKENIVENKIVKTKKLTLKNLLSENYDLDNHPKKKWIKQQLSSIDKKIMEYLFKQYKAVYSAEGMDLPSSNVD